VGSAVFFLADQPQIPVPLVSALIKQHSKHLAAITAPRVNEKRGNPVLFDRITFPELMQLSGDMGGRKLFDRYTVDYVDWDDPNILLDVDTPEDYTQLVSKQKDEPTNS
jgi:molybdenum cofactor cytidylyltransferase